MSAAIVQKSSTQTTTHSVVTAYYECGDIFNLNKSDKSHADQHSNHVTIPSKLISVVDKECNVTMENKGKIDKPKENLNCNYRYHNALTRTISQPPQTLAPQQGSNISALVTPLIEDFGNINLHRKLERTQSEPLPQQVNTSRYKTELCRPFEEAGECKYGEKCQFAHGYHELRNLQRHPKYKTEYCRTFHSVGFCPYGPRCHFVHNADEARASQQQQQQQQQQQHQQQQSPQHTKLQNINHAGNNFNNCLNGFGLPPPVVGCGPHQHQPVQPHQQSSNVNINTMNLGLPLSPPLSMSTGSDRESPTGSLSLSPANSMTNFPFGDQINQGNSVFQQTNFSTYVNTPPESPNAPISPVNTPPPSIVATNAQLQYIKPTTTTTTIPGKQILQKSSSSPIAITKAVVVGGNKTLFKMNSVSSLNGDEARLPVFNRLSSTIEHFPNMAL